ncbi:hypothetical protein [Pseudooceanicola sp. LIPI14-2-Ac024]|uniref:hypothetical protein n=1 Tax=Pseudooceanicola sp. LIPI14-2-Ac024 TaxID=3344875 RepID=UPI0035CEAF14
MIRTIRYDFDMVPVVSGPKRAELETRGIRDARLGEKVALFRDRRAVLALKSADATVRELFRGAGFSLAVSERDLEVGRYCEEDLESRLAVLGALHRALRTDDAAIREADWNGFSLDDFLNQTEAARPISSADRCNVLTWPGTRRTARGCRAGEGN